jgi:asparagine synthase (glutamine-hydrolysing)
MDNIKVHLKHSASWHRTESTYTRGSAFLGKSLLHGSDLSRAFGQDRSMNEFESLLKRMNGFFAVIHECPKEAYFATDHVRSFPLFYGQRGRSFFVSDDPFWIMENSNEHEISELSAIEFLLAGFVVGDESLCKRVRQVRPGEIIHVSEGQGCFLVANARHYRFPHGNVRHETHEALMSRLSEASESAVRHLIELAQDRTIVVPLGAGADCRLIVLMLKRLGYDKVIAFSYGRPGNSESGVAKKVASALGIQWRFVPYSNEAWGKWSRTDEWEDYTRMASGLSSVPHLQDWPAIWELRREGAIPRDSVIAPGHLSAAWNPPVEWIERRVISEDDFLDSIIKRFYDPIDWSGSNEMLRRILRQRIAASLKTHRMYHPEEALTDYERWWWQEEEAKFIINSVRVYDFWGYEWWLPLWDKEFAEFWSSLPVVHTLDREIKKEYVERLQKEQIGRNIELGRPSRILALADRLAAVSHLQRQCRELYGLRQYDKDQFGWYGITPKQVFRGTFTGTQDINSYVGMQTIQNIFPNWGDSLRQGPFMHTSTVKFALAYTTLAHSYKL